MLVAVGLQVSGSILLKVLAEASTARSLLVGDTGHRGGPRPQPAPAKGMGLRPAVPPQHDVSVVEPVLAGALLITAGSARLAARVQPTPSVEP